MVHEIENFYGVYLLYCLNDKYKGRTYIGFTVNPNRRIKQHNTGVQMGGARRTHGKGPWEMVLIVHGFPNMISALRFEWAWTKPDQSRRLKNLPKKKSKEKKFDYCIRVMCHMLCTGPWNRLPLTIRWLKQEYQRDIYSMDVTPPSHIPIQYGPVKSVKVKKISNSSSQLDKDKLNKENKTSNLDSLEIDLSNIRNNANEYNQIDEKSDSKKEFLNHSCSLCSDKIRIHSEELKCPCCNVEFHAKCLADDFLKKESMTSNQLIPIEGLCPSCNADILWGDVIRFKIGCYQSGKQSSEENNMMEWTTNIENSFLN